MKNNIMRVVVLALLVYALTGFASSLRTLEELEQRQAELKTEIAVLERENGVLTEKIANAFTDEAVEKVARQRLALVKPGEKIFIFTVDGD